MFLLNKFILQIIPTYWSPTYTIIVHLFNERFKNVDRLKSTQIDNILFFFLCHSLQYNWLTDRETDRQANGHEAWQRNPPNWNNMLPGTHHADQDESWACLSSSIKGAVQRDWQVVQQALGNMLQGVLLKKNVAQHFNRETDGWTNQSEEAALWL